MIRIIKTPVFARPVRQCMLAALTTLTLCFGGHNAYAQIDLAKSATPTNTPGDETTTIPPGHWVTDSKSGCQIFTRRPPDGLSIEWSGSCNNASYATGHGTVTYYHNGVKEAAVTGEAVQGKMEGKARLVAATGATSEGELKEGYFEGAGTISMPDKGVCEGTFRRGRLEGPTHCTFKNGAKYDGEFKAGQINGKGRYVEPNGDYYDGEYSATGRNGHITGREHRGAAICKLDGEYRMDRFYYGDISCDDGSTVKGYFTNNRLSRGALILKDGTRQEGDFDMQGHLVRSYSVVAPLTPEEQARFDNTLANGKPAQIYFLAGQMARQGHTEESDRLYQKLVDDYPDDVYTAKAIDRLDHGDPVTASRGVGQSGHTQEQHNSCFALCDSQSRQCNADAVSGAMPGATQGVTGAASGNVMGMLSGLGSVLMNSSKDCDTPLRACKAACPP
jgi:hypothetical protein